MEFCGSALEGPWANSVHSVTAAESSFEAKLGGAAATGGKPARVVKLGSVGVNVTLCSKVRKILASGVMVSVLVGCAHDPHGPRATAESYARALESDWRSGEAFVAGGGSPAWVAFYSDASNRQARARHIREALDRSPDASPLVMELVKGQWRVVDSAPADSMQGSADAVLARFIQATDEGDFQTAWTLLAPVLRARYTPQRLKDDFQLEAKSKERLNRVKAAAGQAWRATPEGAERVLGEGKSVKLVREGTEWRVAALE